MRELIRNLVPVRLRRQRLLWKNRAALRSVEPSDCDAGALVDAEAIDLHDLLFTSRLDDEWRDVESRIAGFSLPEKALGVDPGDRRAIYYLVRNVQPRAVLEVGTHIGASTLHIAAALKRAATAGGQPSLLSVDIQDVNDAHARPWLEYGCQQSPAEMVRQLGCDGFVGFVAEPSLEYFAACRRTFDLIFLDGSHGAADVYREIPAALRRLNPGGWILLHDYFPALKPLWSDGKVIAGPYLAVQRLQTEGATIKALPFGALPWLTKLGSNHSSLALLGRTR